MTTEQVDLDVLGASAARVDGAPVALGARRLRSLLALLVLWRGRPVPADRLIDVLWQGAPSPGAGNTLQGYVAGLRRLLEPGRRPRAAPALLVHEAGGYRIEVRPGQVDADRFELVARSAQDRLPRAGDRMRPPVLTSAPAREEAEAVRADLTTALTWWRGDAYADLGDLAAAAVERRRLDQLRLDAHVSVAVLDLALGRPASAGAALEELASRHPLHEQLWGLWAVALAREGRQAHALEVLRSLRRTLADELGIDPCPTVGALLTDLLRQDPTVMGQAVPRSGRPGPRRRGPATTDPEPPDGTAAPPTVVVLGSEGEDAGLTAALLRRARRRQPGHLAPVPDGHDPCGHEGCCHAPPVVVVVVGDGPADLPVDLTDLRRAAPRDLPVIDAAQRSPFRDDRDRRRRTFPA